MLDAVNFSINTIPQKKYDIDINENVYIVIYMKTFTVLFTLEKMEDSGYLCTVSWNTYVLAYVLQYVIGWLYFQLFKFHQFARCLTFKLAMEMGGRNSMF